MFSSYYQAHVNPSMCLFVTSALKSYEHLLFDRTIDVPNSIFEFFVAPSVESCFFRHYGIHARAWTRQWSDKITKIV